jgi:hypothetical protein
MAERKKRSTTKKKGGALSGKVERTRAPRRKSYVFDLRVHSPASLGYLGIDGIDTAPAMVRLAKVKGLDVLAVTDFYSGSFIDRVVEAAEGTKLTVLPGVSLRCTLKDCHDVVLVCLFPEHYRSQDVSNFLEELGISEGRRLKPDHTLSIPFDEILARVEKHHGLIIPSRMDKTPHRIKALTPLVEEYGFKSFDLAYGDSSAYFKERWPKEKFNLFSFSNASALAQVGSRNAKIKLPELSFASLREAIARDASA